MYLYNLDNCEFFLSLISLYVNKLKKIKCWPTCTLYLFFVVTKQHKMADYFLLNILVRWKNVKHTQIKLCLKKNNLAK